MKKIIFSSLLLGGSLFADLNIPEILTDNDYEAYEYQMFVTNTKKISITTDMERKVIFTGEAEDYYKKYVESRKNIYAENVHLNSIDIILSQNKLSKAISNKDLNSLKNLGVASIGAATLVGIIGDFIEDDVYVQVEDYFKNGKRVTRLIKYMVCEDNLDDEELKIAFDTTDNDSYHFRSGGIMNITKKFKGQ